MYGERKKKKDDNNSCWKVPFLKGDAYNCREQCCVFILGSWMKSFQLVSSKSLASPSTAPIMANTSSLYPESHEDVIWVHYVFMPEFPLNSFVPLEHIQNRLHVRQHCPMSLHTSLLIVITLFIVVVSLIGSHVHRLLLSTDSVSMATSLTSVIVGAKAKHTATVFWFHGLGDSGAGWSFLADELSNMFPHVKWILPNAYVYNRYHLFPWFHALSHAHNI